MLNNRLSQFPQQDISPIKQRVQISSFSPMNQMGTIAKQQHPLDAQLSQTQVKSQNAKSPYTVRNDFYGKKDPEIDMIKVPINQNVSNKQLTNSAYLDKFKNTSDLNESEVRRLMNLVELQQSEINQWKRKYDQLEVRFQSLSASQATLNEYDKHVNHLNQEIKLLTQQNEQLQKSLREHENYINKLLKTDEKSQEEQSYLKQYIQQIEKEKQLQLLQKEQLTIQQIDSIQAQFLNQINLLNDQIGKLQQELIKRSEDVEYLKSEIQHLTKEYQICSNNLRKAEQMIENQKIKQAEILEEKRREAYTFQHAKDQQLFQLNKEYSEEKQQLIQKQSQLEYQNSTLMQENNSLLQLNKECQMEITGTNQSLRKLHDNLKQLEEEKYRLQNNYENQIQNQKQHYQYQLEQLMNEVQKLNEILTQKSSELDQQSTLVNQLQGYLNETEKNENQILNELTIWKERFLNIENDYTGFKDIHNQDVDNYENQIKKLTDILEQKIEECDEQRQLKNDLAIKLNEANIFQQKLTVELECLRQNYIESQRQHDVQEEVREEIKRSQLEQLRRQLESNIDQLENENRNLKLLLDGKTRECEEWKNMKLKSTNSNFY